MREYAAVVMSGAGDVCKSVEDVEDSDELGVTEPDRKRNCVGGRKGKVDQELFLKTRANINDHQHDNNKHKPDMVIHVTQTCYSHRHSSRFPLLSVAAESAAARGFAVDYRGLYQPHLIEDQLRQPIMHGQRRPRSSSVTDSLTALIG